MAKNSYHSACNLPKLLEYKNGLVFVLCLSLVIKTIFALFTKVINPDGVLYITAAQQFASGDFGAGLAIYPMPAYSLLILFVHFFIRDWIIAALVLNIVMSVFVLIPLYLLTKNLFDQRVAFWACVAFAFHHCPIIGQLRLFGALPSWSFLPGRPILAIVPSKQVSSLCSL